jgi:Domain of unknown function (DUF4352)
MLRLAGIAIVGMSCALVTAPAGATSPLKPNPKDQALAKTAALHLSDLPSGWTTDTSASQTATGDQIRNAIPDCKRYQSTVVALRNQPRADTSFTQQNASIGSSVAVLSTARAARTAIASLTTGTATACYQKELGALIAARLTTSGSSAKLQSVTGGQQSGPTLGDQSTAYEFTVTLSALGLSPQVYVDVQTVRVGRSVALFTFTDSGSPTPSDLRSSLVTTVVGRLGSPNPSSTPTTTKSGAGAIALGQTGKTASGNSVTVFSYEQPASGLPGFLQPQTPGDGFAAIDVQACATGGSQGMFNPFDLTLQMPDNTRRQETSGKQPALNVTTLNPSDCVRGWITYEVPANQRAASVVYSPASAGVTTVLKWTVS